MINASEARKIASEFIDKFEYKYPKEHNALCTAVMNRAKSGGTDLSCVFITEDRDMLATATSYFRELGYNASYQPENNKKTEYRVYIKW